MNIKKTIAGISALSVLISSGAFSALTASAADTADYKTGKLTAYLYSFDKTQEIECRYYNDMPNVPYIRYSDYYKCWIDQDGQELTIKNNNDGTYEIKVPIGATGTVDVNKDTISSDDFLKFACPEYILNASGSNLFTYVLGEINTSEPEKYTYDYGKYNIDLHGDENDIWWPVQTLCDLYDIAYNQGTLVDNKLYFSGALMTDYSRPSLLSNPEHAKNFIAEYKNGRPKDLAEYNYNELCFSIDNSYGYPGRVKYNDLLFEKGFDTMLSTANESTKKLKDMLLSEDVYAYCAAYEMLNAYFWDGGHTIFQDYPIADGEETQKLIVEQMKSIGVLEGGYNWQADDAIVENSGDAAKAAREEMYKSADSVEKFNSSVYSTKGDTAVFSFDNFFDDSNGWLYYYYANTEMPEDIISEFYNCVMKANEDPAIKNFVIDLSTNIGGSLGVVQYMMGLINDLNVITTVTDSKKGPSKTHFAVDKNLDKAYDEKDAAIKPDLKFAIITSKRSFSCGNLMPSLAKDAGYMLVGERSGGGTCAVSYYSTADGMFYGLSTGLKFVDKDGNSIDDGIAPDYDLVKINEDGTKDFSEVFDFDKLSKLFGEFYKSSSEEQPSTTPAATTSTTTSSTTTTTTTTTTSTTTSSSTSSSSASSSSTTIPTTTTDKTSDLPQTGNNSTGKAAAATCAFAFVVSGGALMLVSRKHRKEDNAAL